MGVREQLIGVLRNSDTQRIRFTFSGTGGATISVDSTSFRRVAQALESNVARVNTGGVADGWAQYNSADNTFSIGAGEHWSRAFDALLVHESVHASFDLSRSRLSWLDNETAGYIAQGYYLRNSGFPSTRLDEMGLPFAALQYVNRIAGGRPSEASYWFDELRSSLNTTPQYHSFIRGTFTGDG